MGKLTMDTARKLMAEHVHAPNLIEHSLAVSAAMGAMAEHFGEDAAYWAAVGYLHDVDYEEYPDTHLQNTPRILGDAGIEEETIRAVLAHGWGDCEGAVEPLSDMEKSLYTVDGLTGLISAAAKMRPMGITDLEVSSLKKKYKDKRFAAKVDRERIRKGCEMLGIDMSEVMRICIEGMKPFAEQLEIGPKQEQ